MAVTINASEVKDGFSTTVPDSEIALWITLAAQADACLDANSVAADVQKILKITAVRHLLWSQANQGRGVVTSEGGPTGASRSFSQWREGGSPYWETLKMADSTGCVRNVIDNKSQMQFIQVGPSE